MESLAASLVLGLHFYCTPAWPVLQRCLFGLHKNGFLFPMLLAVREVPAAAGNAGAGDGAQFVGLMRPIVSCSLSLLEADLT